MSEVFLILHGWGGNKPAHWQEHLAAKLADAGADVRYPQMPDPMAPDPDAWMSALHQALAAIPSDATLTVLAHSLGAINWMRHAAMSQEVAFERPGPKADRVLLVAPPYVIREIPPLDAPSGAATFFPPPLSKAGIAALARETVLVASDTDDYATFDQSSAYAAGLGIDIQKLPGGGHISPYYGYGEWPWALEWALRRATLPPLPNK
ncbi:MAG: alpha/beta hydrolase [Pseudomonadota bacterium]|nr:alpha/beta hydrolase [Pseudomonadota bacterium]